MVDPDGGETEWQKITWTLNSAHAVDHRVAQMLKVFLRTKIEQEQKVAESRQKRGRRIQVHNTKRSSDGMEQEDCGQTEMVRKQGELDAKALGQLQKERDNLVTQATTFEREATKPNKDYWQVTGARAANVAMPFLLLKWFDPDAKVRKLKTEVGEHLGRFNLTKATVDDKVKEIRDKIRHLEESIAARVAEDEGEGAGICTANGDGFTQRRQQATCRSRMRVK